MSIEPALSSTQQVDSQKTKAEKLQLYLKVVIFSILVGLLTLALFLLFTTQAGQQIRDDPAKLAGTARQIVRQHPLSAPALYILLYLLLATTGVLPVWWLQILAGAGFGLWLGSLWSLLAATVSSALTVAIVRWMAADWFHQKVESRMEKLRRLDERLGHNGFLVVMTVRLTHILPFGLCNYAFGITTVSMMNVILGTFLGSIPAIAIYVGGGAGYHPWRNWKFDAIVGGLNVLLLLPLLFRYLRPNWFKKFGVE